MQFGRAVKFVSRLIDRILVSLAIRPPLAAMAPIQDWPEALLLKSRAVGRRILGNFGTLLLGGGKSFHVT